MMKVLCIVAMVAITLLHVAPTEAIPVDVRIKIRI